jgi:hypothetical protein
MSFNNRNNSRGSNSIKLENEFNIYHPIAKLYINELKMRQREIMTYSILLFFFFFSPFSLVGIFYGIRSKKEISRQNFETAQKYLNRANFINLASFIIGSLNFICIILLISLFFFNNHSIK